MELNIKTYHFGFKLQLNEVKVLFDKPPAKFDSTYPLFKRDENSFLDHYQSLTDNLLEETRELSGYLELTGKVNLTRKRLAKYIGQTMTLRNRIADNLYIFEAPPLAWTDIRLSQLDTMNSEELDFKNRYHGMQSSLNVIRENHEFCKDMLQHKHSSIVGMDHHSLNTL